MNKTFGLASDFALMKDEGTRVVIGYGFEAVAESENATWNELYFSKKKFGQNPNIEQVKAAIIADINEQVKAKIIGGFVWNEKPVWLSEENQMNFAQAVVPVTLKIGEQEDGTPIYESFETKNALKSFCEACTLWKQECLSEGWTKKDSIDWTPYEEILNPVSE